MTIGSLHATVVLDARNQRHYGNGVPVTGRVVLEFRPHKKLIGHSHNDNNELFGPLRLDITLHGRAKTNLMRQEGESNIHYRSRVPLFCVVKNIHNDSFKTLAHERTEFPFEICFPDSYDPLAYNGLQQNNEFQAEALLPPSFTDSNFGFGSDYEAFIEYRVGVMMGMPGIQVHIETPGKHMDPVVLYERPSLRQAIPDRPFNATGTVSVSNESLLPESDRPTGWHKLKGKAMSHIHHDFYPKYVFTWQCAAPTIVHILQPLTFRVSIAALQDQCTAVEAPYVVLSNFNLELQGYTSVRAEGNFFVNEHNSQSDSTVLRMGGTQDQMPFSASNDWTQMLTIGKMPDIPSTFATINIARKYVAKIKLEFTVAGTKHECRDQVPVVILPPVDASNRNATNAAQYSSAPWFARNDGNLAPPIEASWP